MHTRFSWGKLRERNHLKDLGVDGRVILKWIFKKYIGGRGLDRSGSGKKQMEGSCEQSS